MILAHASGLGHAFPVLLAAGSVVAFFVLGDFGAPGRRLTPMALWTAGLTVAVVATLPVVERAAERSFTGHMGQHLLLWIVVAPLLVAAHPVREAARAGRFRAVARLAVPLERHPAAIAVAAWTAIVVTLYGTHLTSIYDEALGRPWLHDAEHGAYLAASLAFWAAVLGRRRSGSGVRAILAAASMAPIVLLGMILTTTDTAQYPTYVASLGAGALDDQRTGGAIMWLGSLAALLPLLLWLPWRWATNEQQRQEILEQMPTTVPTNGVAADR